MPHDPDRLLRRLEWTVLRPLDGLLMGDYHTLFQGAGLDFAGLRAYEPGDDVRAIDWNASARRGTTQVRRFHEDREVDAWFLVDTSPSLAFGSKRLKSDVVLETVGALAGVLARQGNRVGACLYSGGLPRLLPATRGRQAVLALLRMLAAPEAAAPGETDLRVPIDAMAGVLRRRSLVFLVSDFASLPGWEASLGRLSVRHEVIAVRIQDPSEHELPRVGMVWLEDAETGRQMFVDTNDNGFRRRFARVTQEHEAALTSALRRSRADLVTLSTDSDLIRSLLGFAHRRRLRKNTRGGAA